eukprot:scaffold742_cov186-Ochromonas_danica.AAC.4
MRIWHGVIDIARNTTTIPSSFMFSKFSFHDDYHAWEMSKLSGDYNQPQHEEVATHTHTLREEGGGVVSGRGHHIK